jgi:hypothetical protein
MLVMRIGVLVTPNSIPDAEVIFVPWTCPSLYASA